MTRLIWRGRCDDCHTEWQHEDDIGEPANTLETECWRCFRPVTWTRWEVVSKGWRIYGGTLRRNRAEVAQQAREFGVPVVRVTALRRMK